MQFVEQRSISYSVILHIAAVFLLLVGIPILLPTPPDPTPMVMSVELLPISEMSNVKPSNEPIREAKHAPTPPKPAKPAPTPPPTPQPKAAPEKSVEKPEPKPFDPTEGAEPVKDKPKPKEEKKEKTQESDFDKMMKDLKKQEKAAEKPVDKTPVKPTPAPADTTPGKDKTNVAENKTKSDAPYDASLPLSISEKDMIRSQFIPCWRAPMGAKDAGSLAVRVKAELGQDAVVKTAVVAPDQMGRYNSDPVFRAAADAAVRAVHKCSPLKGMPADKYGSWSTMEINFDPRDMM